MNLCDICLREYSDCMNDHENLPNIKYGNFKGTEDAVEECDWFMARNKETTK